MRAWFHSQNASARSVGFLATVVRKSRVLPASGSGELGDLLIGSSHEPSICALFCGAATKLFRSVSSMKTLDTVIDLWATRYGKNAALHTT